MVDKILHRKLKIEQQELHYKPWVNAGALKWYDVNYTCLPSLVLRVLFRFSPIVDMPRNAIDNSERQQNNIKCLGFNWKINDEKTIL